MTQEDFFLWGELHHYPQLVLNEQTGAILRHGERAWNGLLKRGNKRRMRQAMQRVMLWESRLAQSIAKQEAMRQAEMIEAAIEVLQLVEREEVA